MIDGISYALSDAPALKRRLGLHPVHSLQNEDLRRPWMSCSLNWEKVCSILIESAASDDMSRFLCHDLSINVSSKQHGRHPLVRSGLPLPTDSSIPPEQRQGSIFAPPAAFPFGNSIVADGLTVQYP